MTAQLADYEWLISDAAAPFLQRCAEDVGGLTRLLGSLRKDLSAERAHLVIEQVDLRRRGKEKFGRAEEMFFTRKGLEQATDEQIASYKASRFPQDDLVVDICCGIGGDLIALAQRSPGQGMRAAGIELDPAIALLAGYNVQRLTGFVPQMRVEDARTAEPIAEAAWHMDPDRRASGKRATNILLLEPPLDVIENRWLQHSLKAGIKVAPATEAPAHWQATCEREWIGSRGECRQQMIWFPGVATHTGKRTATIVDAGRPARIIVEDPTVELTTVPLPARFLYEAHAAVLAAHLSGALAAELGLEALTSDGGYLTGDEPVDDPAAAGFEVLDVLPFDIKQLKSYFRQRGIGRLEIKKRGLDTTPEHVRSQLNLRGQESATLILARTSARTLALVVRRL